MYRSCLQLPKTVKGKDVSVTLKEHRYLEIQAKIGIQDVRRVEGLLRRPVKNIGNGSTWELTSEDSCKVQCMPYGPRLRVAALVVIIITTVHSR